MTVAAVERMSAHEFNEWMAWISLEQERRRNAEESARQKARRVK